LIRISKNIVLLSIFLVKLFSLSYGQNTEIDSLRLSVKELPNDTVKALKLSDLSYRYIKYQLDTSLVYGKEALALSKKLNYPFGHASALNQMGLVHKSLANFDSAMIYYNKALVMFDSLKIDSEKASVLNRMGNVYKRFGEFDKSIECFMISLKIYQNQGDSVQITSILNNLGVLYYDMGYYEKALEYQLLNLEISKRLKNTPRLHTTLMNIGNIYKEEGNAFQAITYYQEALSYLEKSKNKYDKMLLMHNLGVVYEKINKLNEAKQYYNRAITLEKEISEKEMLVYSLQGLGNVFVKQGDYNTGIRYLEESYALANQIKDVRKQHRLSSNLYRVYEKRGNYKKAFNYLKEFGVFEDSIYNLEKKKQFIELEQKYESEKRLHQISILEKEKEIQQLELAKAEQDSKKRMLQRNIIIIAAISIVAFLVYMIYENRRREKLNVVLKKQNNHIRQQRTQIVKQNEELLEANNTKDKLFQIIAHDLRSPLVSIDSLTQLIPFWIEEQDFNSLQKLSKSLEVSISNLLSLIDNLLNWALSQQGKFPFKPETLNLADISKEIMEIYKPIAEFKKIHITCEMCENAFVDADRNMVSAILRNLLNNAIKFTPENGKITVGSTIENEIAHIWVEDNGVGLSTENQKKIFEIANGSTNGTKGETGKGLGLFFCKEFVTLNNGDIFIDSEINKGTKITFTLPARNILSN
jgi:signal transduction histidine kinase